MFQIFNLPSRGSLHIVLDGEAASEVETEEAIRRGPFSHDSPKAPHSEEEDRQRASIDGSLLSGGSNSTSIWHPRSASADHSSRPDGSPTILFPPAVDVPVEDDDYRTAAKPASQRPSDSADDTQYALHHSDLRDDDRLDIPPPYALHDEADQLQDVEVEELGPSSLPLQQHASLKVVVPPPPALQVSTVAEKPATPKVGVEEKKEAITKKPPTPSFLQYVMPGYYASSKVDEDKKISNALARSFSPPVSFPPSRPSSKVGNEEKEPTLPQGFSSSPPQGLRWSPTPSVDGSVATSRDLGSDVDEEWSAHCRRLGANLGKRRRRRRRAKILEEDEDEQERRVSLDASIDRIRRLRQLSNGGASVDGRRSASPPLRSREHILEDARIRTISPALLQVPQHESSDIPPATPLAVKPVSPPEEAAKGSVIDKEHVGNTGMEPSREVAEPTEDGIAITAPTVIEDGSGEDLCDGSQAVDAQAEIDHLEVLVEKMRAELVRLESKGLESFMEPMMESITQMEVRLDIARNVVATAAAAKALAQEQRRRQEEELAIHSTLAPQIDEECAPLPSNDETQDDNILGATDIPHLPDHESLSPEISDLPDPICTAIPPTVTAEIDMASLIPSPPPPPLPALDIAPKNFKSDRTSPGGSRRPSFSPIPQITSPITVRRQSRTSPEAAAEEAVEAVAVEDVVADSPNAQLLSIPSGGTADDTASPSHVEAASSHSSSSPTVTFTESETFPAQETIRTDDSTDALMPSLPEPSSAPVAEPHPPNGESTASSRHHRADTTAAVPASFFANQEEEMERHEPHHRKASTFPSAPALGDSIKSAFTSPRLRMPWSTTPSPAPSPTPSVYGDEKPMISHRGSMSSDRSGHSPASSQDGFSLSGSSLLNQPLTPARYIGAAGFAFTEVSLDMEVLRTYFSEQVFGQGGKLGFFEVNGRSRYDSLDFTHVENLVHLYRLPIVSDWQEADESGKALKGGRQYDIISRETIVLVAVTDVNVYFLDISFAKQGKLFRDAPRPVLLARHFLRNLSRMVIGFLGQTLRLEFQPFVKDALSSVSRSKNSGTAPGIYLSGDGAREGRGEEWSVHGYTLITRDKKVTYDLLQDARRLANEKRLSSPRPLDKIIISNVEEETLARIDPQELLYYQLMYQWWKQQPGIQLPRTVFVTNDGLHICVEDFRFARPVAADPSHKPKKATKTSAMPTEGERITVLLHAHLRDVVSVEEENDPRYITITIREPGIFSWQQTWRLFSENRKHVDRLRSTLRARIETYFPPATSVV